MELLEYLFIINIVSAVVCVVDKFSAIKGWHRVSEKTLFLLSAMGGSVFMYATMCFIRHKTLHKRFMIGLPLMMFFQAVLLIFIFLLTK